MVYHRRDVSVREYPHLTLIVANSGDSHSDFFYHAGCGPDRHVVADHELVLDNEEESGDYVFDELLCAESQSEAANSCSRYDSGYIRPYSVHDHNDQNEEQRDAANAFRQSLQGA